MTAKTKATLKTEITYTSNNLPPNTPIWHFYKHAKHVPGAHKLSTGQYVIPAKAWEDYRQSKSLELVKPRETKPETVSKPLSAEEARCIAEDAAARKVLGNHLPKVFAGIEACAKSGLRSFAYGVRIAPLKALLAGEMAKHGYKAKITVKALSITW